MTLLGETGRRRTFVCAAEGPEAIPTNGETWARWETWDLVSNITERRTSGFQVPSPGRQKAV